MTIHLELNGIIYTGALASAQHTRGWAGPWHNDTNRRDHTWHHYDPSVDSMRTFSRCGRWQYEPEIDQPLRSSAPADARRCKVCLRLLAQYGYDLETL